MMLDRDVVAVSPTSTWRVLSSAGLLGRRNNKPSKKGTGFHQPKRPHRHWHVDISYINVSGTFYYLCSVLDGYSRFIVHWELRESMTEAEIEVILQRARERFCSATPRIISDNGPQFIAKDFKEFIRICGMTHVRTSPYYPQSNGKIERWHQSLKSECIRPKTPLCLGDAQRLVGGYVDYYNTERLHSAIEYVTPKDKLAGREKAILAARDRRLESAREQRRRRRQERQRQERREDGGTTASPPRLAVVSETRRHERLHEADHLRSLRNDVPVRTVISELQIPTQTRGSRLTFRCPACGGFHTATDHRTNLARCFRCSRNFNPIELVMAERRLSFPEAVKFLETLVALPQ